MKKKIVYICGKVTGLPIHEVTMHFGTAQKMLQEKGYEVVNPLEVVNDFHCPWNVAMRKCIYALVHCDAIYILPSTNDSKGAALEIQIAGALQIDIIKI